jgi:putative membrane protein
MVGKSDQQFMTKAAQSGMMEVKMAQMAQQKAASSEVKEYARKLEQDHSKANDQLKKIAQDRGVQLPSDMGQHQQQMAKFENLSGEEFDRAYMKMQVQHHKKDIGEFKKHQNRSMDTDLKEFATAQLPILQQHYEQAQQLNSSTGTRSRKADQSGNTGASQSGGSTSGSSTTGSSTSGSSTSGSSTGNSTSGTSGTSSSKPNNQ